MSRSMGIGSNARRSAVRTAGPQEGNMTVGAYQEHRSVSRSRDSTTFPGDISDKTMRVDENEIVFAFKTEDERVATRDTYEYGSHKGLPVFTCLNGIEMDRFEFMDNARVVGVSKSHTTNDDDKAIGVTQFAVYIGGTFTIINNGTKLIPAGSEIIVMIYDKIHTPDMFDAAFSYMSPAGYRGGEEIRILGVVEPYERSSSLMDTIRRFGKAEDYRVESDENLRSTSMDGRKFGLAKHVETMEEGISDLLLMGAFLFSVLLTNDRVILDTPAEDIRDRILRLLKNNTIPLGYQNRLQDMDDVLRGGPGNEDISMQIFRLITMNSSTEKLSDATDESAPGFATSYHGLVSQSQKGLAKFYSGFKKLGSFERQWVIGKSTKMAAPGEALDLIIRR